MLVYRVKEVMVDRYGDIRTRQSFFECRIVVANTCVEKIVLDTAAERRCQCIFMRLIYTKQIVESRLTNIAVGRTKEGHKASLAERNELAFFIRSRWERHIGRCQHIEDIAWCRCQLGYLREQCFLFRGEDVTTLTIQLREVETIRLLLINK